MRVAEAEQAGPFQEELALLGEEQAEAGEVDLDVVRLHLREVGIERGVQGEVGRDRVLHVEAQVVEGLGGTTGRVQAPGGRAPGDGERLHLHVAAPAQSFETGQGRVAGHLREGVPDLLADVREVHHLVLAAYGALHEDPHDGRVGVGETDGRKGDGRLDHPAVLGDSRLALVDPFPVPVRQRHRLVGDERVALGAEGIDLEDVGVAPVVVRVESDADVVVLVDSPFAVQDAAPDSFRVRVVEYDGEVEVVVVEGHAELGALRRGSPVHGDALAKVRDRFDFAPERLVENRVDGGRVGRADGPDRRPRRRRILCGGTE